MSRSDGGVNSYSQKVYEIFSTLLLRDYCIFGLSPISLPQLLVMLRDTTGEKEKFNPFHSLKFMFTLTDFLLSLFDYNIIFTVLPAYLIR